MQGLAQKRFAIKKQLGQGSFSTIYSAYDNIRKEIVALKVEKSDKSKKVLIFEYQVLKHLQGLPNICSIYDFVESEQANGANFIVMQMLGKNLATIKKDKGKDFTSVIAIKLLLQMLDAIEKLHNCGYIHRDIKPSNFVMGKGKTKSQVFMVDLGLARMHLQKNGNAIEPRPNADFRGTTTYASLNAHQKVDLSRRDDLWSFYFVILDFLNEPLPWRNCKDNKMDEVRDLKAKCMMSPEKHLWRTTTAENVYVKKIFYHLKSLAYRDRPDYQYIRDQLTQFLHKEEGRELKSEHGSIAMKRGKRNAAYYSNYSENPAEPKREEGQKQSLVPNMNKPQKTAPQPPIFGANNIFQNYSGINFLSGMQPFFNPLLMPRTLLGSEFSRPSQIGPFSAPQRHVEVVSQEEKPAAQNDYLRFGFSNPMMYSMNWPYSSTAYSQYNDLFKSLYQYPISDNLQLIDPKAININNVNAMGNAFIINTDLAPPKASPEPLPPEEPAIPQKEVFFTIKVDSEFYRKRYSKKIEIINNGRKGQ